MKTLKKILLILLAIIALPLIAALFIPNQSSSEGQIVVNKPKLEVFDYIKQVKNQDHFGVWQLSDPGMKTTSEGIDGTEGFRYSWDSEKLGKGAQVITHIVEGERMESDMFFFDVDDSASKAYFTTEEQSPNQTIVKWGISWRTPYPWNIMNAFYNMDDDFQQGLKKLKEIVEQQKSPKPETTFALSYYQETMANLQKQMAGLSPDQLHFKPAENAWSVSQCLEHMVVTEKMIFDMVQETMKKPANPERRKDLQYTDKEIMAAATDRSKKYKAPEVLIGKGKFNDPETAINELKKQRAVVLDFIRRTPPEELRNQISDAPSGVADAYQSLLFMAGHTARHTLQIAEVKASAGFPKS